jgi:hypothetical protein
MQFNKTYDQNERKIKAIGKNRGSRTTVVMKNSETPYTKNDFIDGVGSGRYTEDRVNGCTEQKLDGGTKSRLGRAYSDMMNKKFSNAEVVAVINILNDKWVENGVITDSDVEEAIRSQRE